MSGSFRPRRGAPPARRLALLLEARSLDHRASAALQPSARLTVHSVFERAVNLLDRDGQLIGLVGPDGRNGPGLVVLASLPDCGFAPDLVGRGQVAGVDQAAWLWIGQRLVIGLAGATVWERPRVRARLEPERIRVNTARAAELAYRLKADDGLGGLLPHLDQLLRETAGERPGPAGPGLLARVAWEALVELLSGVQLDQPQAIRRAVWRLVGLGPGQTPSGDDLLAGLLVAWGRLRPQRSERAAFGATCLEAAHGRTTDLGLARLRYAVQGELDERSERALEALLAGQPAEVEEATRELLAYGHSSGLDTLVGLLLGIGLGVGESESRG